MKDQRHESNEASVKVIFVCMGNICRSPTAEGVFRKLIEVQGLDRAIETDSAGTHGYHAGESPDRRARETAARRGVDLSDLRARQVGASDFDYFDYVLAMDEDNLRSLSAICPPDHRDKLVLFMEFAPHLRSREVPDPYYGAAGGFDRVFDMVEAAAEGLLNDIRQRFL